MSTSVVGVHAPHGRIVAIGNVAPAPRSQTAVRNLPARPLDVVVDALDAVGCEDLALPRWCHLPSPTLVPFLEGIVTQVALTTGRSSCGHGVGCDQLTVVRLSALSRPHLDCVDCAQFPPPPSACLLCFEVAAYWMVVIHDVGRVLAVVNLCRGCAEGELEDDPERLAWAPIRTGRRPSVRSTGASACP